MLPNVSPEGHSCPQLRTSGSSHVISCFPGDGSQSVFSQMLEAVSTTNVSEEPQAIRRVIVYPVSCVHSGTIWKDVKTSTEVSLKENFTILYFLYFSVFRIFNNEYVL